VPFPPHRQTDVQIRLGVYETFFYQFDALTSFTYNVGVGAFGDSTLLKKLKVNPNDPTIRNQHHKTFLQL
jgi:GH24 family phage-related lysozyme (muramidase)